MGYLENLVANGQLTTYEANRWRSAFRHSPFDPEQFDFGLANYVRPRAPAEWDECLRQWKRQPYTVKQSYGPAVRFAKKQRTEEFFPPAITPASVRQKVIGAVSGYLGAIAGLENGRLNLGRPLLASETQMAEIERLHDKGMSRRAIALRVFGHVRYKDRVSRCLKRLAA
jgi:hypothetical protein